MPRTTDPRVDAYLEHAAPFARPILRHVRALVHAACPEAAEALKWSQPAFVFRGKILCIVPAFKSHCALVLFQKEARAMVGDDARGFRRITRLADLPNDAKLRRYFRQAAKLIDHGPMPAKAASRPAKQPPPRVPPDLAVGLRKNKKAAATFGRFPPSHRREYIEWVAEAKREETRARRLATTLEWLAQGKPRNWKYVNC